MEILKLKNCVSKETKGKKLCKNSEKRIKEEKKVVKRAEIK